MSQQQAASKSTRLFVAAIDFGTTYSGYAFSSKAEWVKVRTPKWAGNMMSFKAPTAVLLNSDQSFHSFGYEAETKYIELAGDKEHTDYFYFHRFKMTLKKEKIHRHVTMKDATGKPVEAMTVFSLCIKYLKDLIVSELNKSLSTDVRLSDIQFILTVPAIWNDTAKMFMREAATTAGIEADQLWMALEPEAASIYCQHLHLERDEIQDDSFMKDVKSGKQYMVVDLGGGTADITVHQRLDDGTLEELVPASGGDWGGTSVDETFRKFILDLLGENVMDSFKKENMEDYLQLFNDFEAKKRAVLASKTGNIHMTVPFTLMALLKKIYKTKDKKECMQKAFEQSTLSYKDQVAFENNKIRMPVEIFKGFFTSTTHSIVEHMKKLYREKSVSEVKTILMVGGFSESSIVQAAIQEVFGPDSKDKMFGGKRIIVPEESGLAVLKGAVYFGHIPDAISRRVSRYTYGIQSYPEFNPSRHPADKKVMIDGVARCKDVFFPYVRKGEQIKPGQQHSQVFQALRPKESKLECAVYISERADPEYITEAGCKKLGVLTIALPPRRDGEMMELEETMIFGETELRVKARDIYTHTEKEIKFDLLEESNVIT